MEDIKNVFKNFISDRGKIPLDELCGTTEILDSGILSSLTVLEMMAYIEKQFKIEIEPEELILENFKDIDTVSTYVKKKIEDIGFPSRRVS
jgi:methoxymalonate biosynthesis acyl carrier protein